MSASVVLAAVDREQFDRSVASPVDLTEDADAPEALADRDEARLWGVGEGSNAEQVYERMGPGDLVLFRDGDEYAGVGTVGEPFEDESGWVADAVPDGAPSRLLYTVEEFATIAVPSRAINRIFGYSPGYSPPDVMRVADDRVPASPDAIRLAARRFTERHA